MSTKSRKRKQIKRSNSFLLPKFNPKPKTIRGIMAINKMMEYEMLICKLTHKRGNKLYYQYYKFKSEVFQDVLQGEFNNV